MTFNTKLTREEKQIIKRIARVQLKDLNNILERKTKESPDLFCVMQGLSIEEFDEVVREDIKVFESVLKNPQSFLNLTEMNLSIFKHIMTNFLPKRLEGYKHHLWRKLNLRDKLFKFNPNIWQ